MLPQTSSSQFPAMRPQQ